MKKLLLYAAACLVPAAAFAQDHKAELVAKITEKHTPLYADAVDQTATINLSESMWALVLGEAKNPKGYSTFKRLGKAFVDLSDHFGATMLEKKCGFGVTTTDAADNAKGCTEVIDGWKGKYSFTLNAPNVEAGNDAFKMVTGYVSSVAIYLEDGSASLWQHGYVPKTDKLHIVINADKKFKVVSVKWSPDGSTVTIDGPADVETVGWDSKIEKGLIAGWKKG